MSNIPKHVALIPDGNRRWAKAKGLKETAGHFMAGSYKNMKELFTAAKDLKVRYVSIWGFSTENWKRSKTEVNVILDVILKGVKEFIKNADVEKTAYIVVGRKDRLPKELVEKMEELEEKTKKYKDFTAVLCIDYGGRDEIVRAVNKIIKTAGHLEDIDEKQFSSYLDTKYIPEPELVIRTGGERRLSGFMPFQTVYSEIYFSDKYFPDFSGEDLKKAILDFAERERRFGE